MRALHGRVCQSCRLHAEYTADALGLFSPPTTAAVSCFSPLHSWLSMQGRLPTPHFHLIRLYTYLLLLALYSIQSSTVLLCLEQSRTNHSMCPVWWVDSEGVDHARLTLLLSDLMQVRMLQFAPSAVMTCTAQPVEQALS